MTRIELQGITPEALAKSIPELSLSEARKTVSAVHRETGWEKPRADIRRASLAAVVKAGVVPELEVVAKETSEIDAFCKLALRTHSGHMVEAVRLPLEKQGAFSACVSSQAGCAMACGFCATGQLGLLRNLQTWEIVEQVRLVRRTLMAGERITGVVFQGMGEPLSNLDRVLAAIAVLCEPSGQAIDARNMTVCTVGLPSGIRRLAEVVPRVRLGISIGSARSHVRKEIMPITSTHPLDTVMEAAAFHARSSELSPMFALTLLRDVNDTDEDANALVDLVRAFAKSAGRRPRMSIIPYNSTTLERDPFARTTDAREAAFRAILHDAGIPTHKRYSGGSDIAAACGQLAGKSRSLLSVARPIVGT